MSAPVISASTALIDFPVGETWIFQPAASGEPTSWTWTGLPAGTDYNPVTGAIGGTVMVQGLWMATVKSTNADGDSDVVEIPISIYYGPWNATASVEVKIDAATGKLLAPETFELKADTDLLLDVGFYAPDGTTLLSLNLALLEFVVKLNDTDETFLFKTEGTFVTLGDVSTRHYRVIAAVRGDLLTKNLEEKPLPTGTTLSCLGEFRYYHGIPIEGSQFGYQKITRNFAVTITRNLLQT